MFSLGSKRNGGIDREQNAEFVARGKQVGSIVGQVQKELCEYLS